jgi:hypothetical protein
VKGSFCFSPVELPGNMGEDLLAAPVANLFSRGNGLSRSISVHERTLANAGLFYIPDRMALHSAALANPFSAQSLTRD